jgi:hypothetical protein
MTKAWIESSNPLTGIVDVFWINYVLLRWVTFNVNMHLIM